MAPGGTTGIAAQIRRTRAIGNRPPGLLPTFRVKILDMRHNARSHIYKPRVSQTPRERNFLTTR